MLEWSEARHTTTGETLGVVVVRERASVARDTRSPSSPADPTALSPSSLIAACQRGRSQENDKAKMHREAVSLIVPAY
jgi:hypothetical protein